ncbi:CDP-glycerol glycerophosphotransferase family protein [Nocardiopsis sp. FIRDI 009]|uniref:CDP-glycerol glycerophosphotransferase family protein n=1 Tax=Nocardiopsis sp. FIRDI 009 TaxID=714197 RepID=UPI000E28046A|nr:CDP-glycerol glycerophosphotransferase family protein [Nocardiopsis sp. FIRDI 009]
MEIKRPSLLAGVALTGLGLLVSGVALVAGLPAVFLVAALVGYAGELALRSTPRKLGAVLDRVGFGVPSRSLVRVALALTLAFLAGAAAGWVLAAAAVLVGGRVLCAGLTVLIQRALPPVDVRNIDAPGLAPFKPRERLLSAVSGPAAVLLEAPLVLGVGAAALTGAAPVAVVGGALCVLPTLALVGAVCAEWSRARRASGAARGMRGVQSWLNSYRPEVVLYFSGSADSAYQVNMWLGTVEKLPQRCVVVLRERPVADRLGPTTLPVLCVPKATDLMALDFADARVALYSANTGKNIHMLRNPGMRHVFIGHGDSDKVASVNPFSKVYDEVWTAGRGGRDRYARAAVGVRDDEIVEVGRPQLAPIRTTGPGREVRTVLYAPTWEGWTDDPGNTSLIEAGPNLVAALLDASPELRVVYKPHPFTGMRSPAAKRAHQRVVDLIRRAGGRVGGDHSSDEAFWSGVGDREHLVIEGATPTLYSCFNESDLLVSDISSVVADFVASGKPYAITNCEGITDEEFRIKHPTSRAAYLLAPDASGLDTALAALRGRDPMLQERRDLKEYLLGPDSPDAQTRFAAAVADLYERTARHVRERQGAETAVTAP